MFDPFSVVRARSKTWFHKRKKHSAAAAAVLLPERRSVRLVSLCVLFLCFLFLALEGFVQF